MKLGDTYTWTPSAWADSKPVDYEHHPVAHGPKVTGRVIFLDPKGRFFTVEAHVDGGIIRESIQYVDVPQPGKQDRKRRRKR